MNNALAKAMNGKDSGLIEINKGFMYSQARRFRVGGCFYQRIDKGIIAATGSKSVLS